MKGIIVLWSGAIVDIPSGWALCDGTQGTPDLRNMFVVGAGDTYAVDASGGATSHNHGFTTNGHDHDLSGEPHTHDFTSDAHSHNLQAGQFVPVNYPTGPFSSVTALSVVTGTTDPNAPELDVDSNDDFGTTDPESHLPPYYALAYIMKL